jgi:hypothetical protein
MKAFKANKLLLSTKQSILNSNEIESIEKINKIKSQGMTPNDSVLLIDLYLNKFKY